jgi:hypothetical protein
MSLDVLRHPVRVRIVEACTDWGQLSPAEIVSLGLCADIESIRTKTPKQALANISYHCRKLEEFDFLTLVKERPVRGATEHFYEANIEAVFEDEEWSGMSEGERRDISRVVWQRLIAQVEGSMHQHTFDARTDRWLAWGPLELDEQGWEELMDEISETYVGINAIKRQAEARLAASGEVPMRATYALFGFESPRSRPTKPSEPETRSDERPPDA